MSEDKTKQIQENLLQASNALLAVGSGRASLAASLRSAFMGCGLMILGLLLLFVGCSMMAVF